MKIAGSFLRIQEDKEKIKKLNDVVDQIHFDIMDGKFTENPTLDLNVVAGNLLVDKPIDVHLMVLDITKYVDAVLRFKPEYITFHIEATDNPKFYIDYIRSKGVKVGIAINPETDFNKIYPYLKMVDLVLVMAVHPGKGGQKFIDITNRIRSLCAYRMYNGLNFIVEVDGGINNETIEKIYQADVAVAGAFITNSDDYEKQVDLLRGELYE